MNRKILNIIKFTFEKDIRNKWFIVLNIVLFLLTVIVLNYNTVSTILKENNINLSKNEINIEVKDDKNLYYENLQKNLENYNGNEKINIKKVDDISSYTKDNIQEKILIEVKYSSDEIISLDVVSKEGFSTKIYNIIKNTADSTKESIIKQEYNISDNVLEKLKEETTISRTTLAVDNKDSDIKTIMQTISNYLILIILMIVLSKIANDISQEKMSKSIEYVLTSISSTKYLIAKILSINITLIIQVIFSVVYFVIGTLINNLITIIYYSPNLSLNSNAINGISTFNIDSSVIIFATIVIVFMILTVLVQCIIQAAVSAKTTNITEASNSTFLLVVINLCIYMVASLVITPLKVPNILIYILSCLPIISMYFIPTMLLLGQANVIQIIIATVLLIVSIPVLFRVCGKIFKNGVLDYSNKKNKKKDNKNISKVQIQKNIIKKKEFTRFGFIIGMSMILFIVCQLGISVILTPVIGIFNISDALKTQILNMVTFVLSLLIPSLFIGLYINNKRKDSKEDNNSKNELKKDKQINKNEVVGIGYKLKYVLMTLPIVFILQIVLNYIYTKLGMNFDVLETFNMFNSSSVLLMILFFIQTAILPAIFEEYFIRDRVLNLCKKYGNLFAIIFSSLMFAILHMNLTQGIFAFLMGIILSVVVIKTKDLKTSMIIHFLNNGYAAITMIFEQNMYALSIINLVYFAMIIIGTLLISKELLFIFKDKKYKKKGKDKKVLKEKNRISNFVYMFLDYPFIIAIILSIVTLIVMEVMLRIL